MLNFGKTQIRIACPKCKYENTVSLEDVAKQVTVICAGCLRSLKLIDSDGSTNQAVKSVNSSLDSIKRKVKQLSK